MQLPLLLQRLRGGVATPRALHLSPLYAVISKPRVKEEDEPVNGTTPPTPIDMGAKVTAEHCHDSTLEKEDGEWTEMRLSWRELPNAYLKLSKSRLTCEWVCLYYCKPHP